MLRLPLTAVLIGIMALPHGICFCHYVEAAPPCLEPVCCESHETTQIPPADAPEDHDQDCLCCKRQVPTTSPAPVDAKRDGSFNFATFLAVNDTLTVKANAFSLDCSTPFRLLVEPIPLILCALRI